MSQPINIREKALAALKYNTRTTRDESGQERTYTVPSPTTYPFQWTGWDSQFHVIVFARLGETDRAKAEFESILAAQQADGLIPHVTFWDPSQMSRRVASWHLVESRERRTALPWTNPPKHTAMSQPPLLGQALESIYEATGDAAYVAQYLPAVERYYRWLADNRDPDNDGLISVISQFETGIDYSPAYDAVIGYQYGRPLQSLELRSRAVTHLNKWIFNYRLERIFRWLPFHTEDVLVNSIYIKNLQVLERLAGVSRETQAAARWFAETHQKAMHSLYEKCYDPDIGLFWNLTGKNETPVRVKTIISLMPLILDNLPEDATNSLLQHLTDPTQFWSSYPIPSVSMSEPTFSADNHGGYNKPAEHLHRYIWRGAATMNTNWYIVEGLRSHGFNAIADQIADKSRELVQTHGFNEFYRPDTGEPCGAKDFGWATLAAIM